MLNLLFRPKFLHDLLKHSPKEDKSFFHSKTDWHEHYEGANIPIKTTDESKRNPFTYVSDGNVWIKGSSFETITSSTDGGVIHYLGSDSSKMLVEHCLFSSCCTIGNNINGGSIWLNSGQCIIDSCCSYNSTAANYGQFCYILASNKNDAKNQTKTAGELFNLKMEIFSATA